MRSKHDDMVSDVGLQSWGLVDTVAAKFTCSTCILCFINKEPVSMHVWMCKARVLKTELKHDSGPATPPSLLGPRLLQVHRTQSHQTSHVQYQSSQLSVYLKAHLAKCIRVSWTVHMLFSSFPTALNLVQGPIWWFDLLEFLYHSKGLSPWIKVCICIRGPLTLMGYSKTSGGLCQLHSFQSDRGCYRSEMEVLSMRCVLGFTVTSTHSCSNSSRPVKTLPVR